MASTRVGAMNCYRTTRAVITYLAIFHSSGCIASEFASPLRTAAAGSHDRMMISDDRFRICLADLDDAAWYGTIRPQDYTDFIDDYSDGKISVRQFRELPSSLISTFNSISCSFCEDDDLHTPTSCCSGELPYIDLSIVSPNQLRDLCSAIDKISYTPSPTPGLSLSPTSDKSAPPASLIVGSASVLISDERFLECITDMDQASFNGTLRPQDFDDFIRVYSGRKFDGFQFNELPPSLITEFNSLACNICSNDDYYAQTNCCSGKVTYIDLSTISPVNLRLLCTAIDDIYGAPMPPTPPAPTSAKSQPTIGKASPSEEPLTGQPVQGGPSPSLRYPMRVTATKKPRTLITSSPSVSDSPRPEAILATPTKKPLSTAKPTLSPTESNAPSLAPSNAPRKTSMPSVSPSLKPKIKPIKKKSTSAPLIPSAIFPSKASPTLNVAAPFVSKVVVIVLTVSVRTEGINATSFMTGENPTNDEKTALTNATATAIDKILENRGDGTELSSVTVTSVDDSRCIYPPSETLATKCLYVNIGIEISVPSTVDAEKLKKSLIEELQQNPITFSR